MSTIHWASGINGDWATKADWAGGTVPGAADDVFIDAAGTYNVTISTAQAAHSLMVNDATATVVDNSTLTIGTTLTLTAGTFTLNSGGTIVGGTLSATGGTYKWNGGTLSGVTYDGALGLSANAVLRIKGGLTATGVNGTGPGTINATGSNAGLIFDGQQTLDNATLNIGNVNGTSLSLSTTRPTTPAPS